eukprot:5133974-Pleurochrysis_carterae.AAC.1
MDRAACMMGGASDPNRALPADCCRRGHGLVLEGDETKSSSSIEDQDSLTTQPGYVIEHSARYLSRAGAASARAQWRLAEGATAALQPGKTAQGCWPGAGVGCY